MKIIKTCKLNQQPVQLIREQVVLEWQTPGRALLTLKPHSAEAIPKAGQAVALALALDDDPPKLFFSGYVEQVSAKAPGIYTLLAREFSAVLNQRLAVSLRHCTAKQVLELISEQSALQFVLEDAEWTTALLPRFQHIGGGYMALDMIGVLWGVPQFCWHQQSDGRIYVGSWQRSVTGHKHIRLPIEVFKAPTIEGASLPLIPRLRPGVQIETQGIRRWVTRVEMHSERMRLTWSTNPWHTHLKAIR